MASTELIDLASVTQQFARLGDPDHDQDAAERYVELAELYLGRLSGASSRLIVRAGVRLYLANGLLGPLVNGALKEGFQIDLQRAIGELNKAAEELRGPGNEGLLCLVYERLALSYRYAYWIGPPHLYQKLALRFGERAVELTDASTSPDVYARARETLALIYNYSVYGLYGDYVDRAIELLREAADKLAEDRGSELWCDVMSNLGSTYGRRSHGDPAANLALALETLEQVTAVETEQQRPLRWAHTQKMIGNIHLKLGNPRSALSHFRAAERVYERHAAGRMTEDLDSIYRDLSETHRLLGDGDESLRLLRKLISAYSLGSSLSKARSIFLLANALREEQPENAFDLLNEARTVLIDFPEAVRDRTFVALAMANHAREGHEAGRPQLLNDLVDDLASLKEPAWDDPQIAWRVCSALGDAYVLLGNWPAAADSYVSAVDRLELLYRSLLLFRSRAEELSETIQVRHNAAYTLARAGRPREAGAVLSSARARVLRELLNRDQADLVRLSGRHPLEYTEFAAAAEALRAVEVRDRGARPGDPSLTSLAEQARVAAAALETAVNRIRHLPEFAGFLALPKWDPDGAGIPQIFMVATRMGCLIIAAAETVEAHFVDGVTLADIGTALGLGDVAEVVDGRRLVDAVETLGARFADALGAAVGSADLIQLIPCGPLGVLPLHLLRVRQNGWQRRLVDVCAVEYALVQGPHRADIPARLITPAVAVGDPLDDLAAVDDELRSFQTIHSGARVLTGPRATKGALMAESGDAGLIHFACHGSFDWQEPYNSGLHLADGILTVGELLDMYPPPLMKARLVTLSSCESAVVDFRSYDQVMGIPAAMAYAGAGAVLGTLWRVSDSAAALLMSEFYARLELVDGLIPPDGPARALRGSLRWLRDATASEILNRPYARSATLREFLDSVEPDEAPFASPRYWGAFVVLGR